LVGGRFILISTERGTILAREAKLMVQILGATPINNSISQMQIPIHPLANRSGVLYVNFSQYPLNPPILILSNDIKPYINLSFSLDSAKNWNVHNPPHIKDIVLEFIRKLSDYSKIGADFHKSPSELNIQEENAILNKFEISVKAFFYELMGMEIKMPIIYCETKEEYRKFFVEAENIFALERDALYRIAEKSGGRAISGKGVFINKALDRERFPHSIKHYFYSIVRTIVHELFGHCYINENTSLGKLVSKGLKVSIKVLIVTPFAQELLKKEKQKVDTLSHNIVKFTHEGWAEWVSWYFNTYYDDPTLRNYIIPVNERELPPYHDLETFKGYLQAFLTFIKMGHFKFKNYLPVLSFNELRSNINQCFLILNMIPQEFEKIIQILEGLLNNSLEFSKKNLKLFIDSIQTLSALDEKYAIICPTLTYGIGFLICKKIQEKYGLKCMPILLKLVLDTRAKSEGYHFQKYYRKFKDWHDYKLALLLIIPITPEIQSDEKKCWKIVKKYL